MPKKLFITDERMLKLIDYAVENGIVQTETEYLEKIDFPRTSIKIVRNGTQGFRKTHILNACNLTGASADYVFGFTNVIKRKQSPKAMDLLKEAMAAVEVELKRNK